ncbi:sigma-70 family RNA polymerase sigma factor [Kordia sp. TARA_039_SRF]|nr:sigma-70 family RNA polymerase sigma factor [Kordia sp. TARA_039_SRF]MAF31662.1 hypothetical protein [Magnetococcales bacterium]MEC8067828.1 RNA polymerase sigma factor [Pseudomonadota bacterium]
MNLTEENLKKLFLNSAQGDEKSYQSFLLAVEKICLTYLSKKITNSHHHHDITQEVLISIHQARESYDPCKPIKPWISAIIFYRTADHLRAVYKNKEDSTFQISEENTTTPVTNPTEEYEYIEHKLKTLNPRSKKVLVMAKMLEMSHKEIAKATGLSVSNVKITLHRTLKKLRKQHEEEQ